MIPGTVDDGAFAPTATEFETSDISETTLNHFKDRMVLWSTGALAGQVAAVQGYALVGGKGHFTVSELTEAPANGDAFLLV